MNAKYGHNDMDETPTHWNREYNGTTVVFRPPDGTPGTAWIAVEADDLADTEEWA